MVSIVWYSTRYHIGLSCMVSIVWYSTRYHIGLIGMVSIVWDSTRYHISTLARYKGQVTNHKAVQHTAPVHSCTLLYAPVRFIRWLSDSQSLDRHLMGPTNSGYYRSRVKVGDIWYQNDDDDVKRTRIELRCCKLNNVCMWCCLKGIGLSAMGRHVFSELKRRHRKSNSTGSSWTPFPLFIFNICVLFGYFNDS